MLLPSSRYRCRFQIWCTGARGPVGPCSLVGEPSLPDLVPRSSWARGPVGPCSLVGEPALSDLVTQSSWARGPVGPRSLVHKFSLEEAVLTIFSIFVRTASSRADCKISSKLVAN